jgi:RND superfamily putative drug exporter
MEHTLFFRFGSFVYKYRFQIILVWIIALLCTTPFIAKIMTPFKVTGFKDQYSESATADDYLTNSLGYGTNRFVIMYHSDHLLATSSAYQKKIKNSLANLDDFPIKHDIIYPDMNEKQISKNKHTAYVVVLLRSKVPIDHALLTKFTDSIEKPSNMSMHLGGEPMFIESISKQTQVDLYKADTIAAPISIIILILVFGTIIAAILPMVLGGGCALIILILLYCIGHLFSLSIFTINIALLLGLCLSLDYSLFIVSRLRYELRSSKDIPNVIATTLATAGRAIFYSGMAVFASLSALLLFPINILFSVGVGGLTAVFVAVAIAITLLPAILAILKENINLLPVRINRKSNSEALHFWRRIATMVINWPILFFSCALILLLLLGYPFLNVRFGISDVHILPNHTESRAFFDIYKEKFNENELTPIQLIITTQHNQILSKQNIANLYDFTQKLKKFARIERIESIVTSDAKLKKAQYQALYSSSKRFTDPDIRILLKTTTRKHMTLISVVSKYPVNSSETKKLVTQLRQLKPGKGMQLQITGVPVNNIDVMQRISDIFPYAVVWIISLTYLILLLLLRSLFLPFKAILMNILSLCASYGVLVFIFQEGHLHQLLNFDPQGMLDISLLIIIFCALFGFSMDYEVFLLTRIQEAYRSNGDHGKSIIFGIEQSSRIITSAAIIVIFICGSFMVADVLMVKEFGLGIAVAIFVDAFIVRTILVPSTMILIKHWNWYLPKWLERLLPK